MPVSSQNARKIGAAIGFVVAILIIGVAVVLMAREDDEIQADLTPTAQAAVSPSPQLTPGATETPASTATPRPGSLTPIEQADEFELEAVEGLLELVRLDAGEEVDSGTSGAYFMNIETGDIEGWRVEVDPSVPIAFSDDNRFVLFERPQETRRGNVTYPAGQYLADRETETVYRWNGDAIVVRAEVSQNNPRLATRGDLVLFRIEDAVEEDSYVVVSVDDEPETVATFRAEGWLALFSEDGNTLALYGEGESVALVDVESGEVSDLGATLPGRLDLEGSFSFRNTGGGDDFLLTVNPVKPGFDAAWLRYDWDGDLQHSDGGPYGLYPSANGEHVALVEPLLPGEESWPELTVFDAVSTADGSSMFRVVGAVEWFGFSGGDIWLADGSGFVIADPSMERHVVLRNGQLRPSFGIPSPTDATVFATTSPADRLPMSDASGPAVSDFSGNVLASADAFARSFLSPWGMTGDEIRFITPHGGHGGEGFVRSLAVPYVDQPPYESRAELLLDAAAFGKELLDAPVTGAATGTVNTSVVTVLELARVRLEGGDPGYERYCDLMNELAEGFEPDCRGAPLWGQWALVVSLGNQPGAPGWLLLGVNPEGL